MSINMKLAAGSPFPAISIPRLGGGKVLPAFGDGWRLFIVYRGRHCPLCKIYLKTLNDLMDEFSAIGIAVMVASGDPEEKAAADLAEHGWRFPVGYAMTMAQMRMLGLYLSEPRSAQETDRPFPEPGLFLINPEGQLQIIDISNAPFARPDLAGIARGAKRIQEMNYPIRGTLV